LGDENHPVGDRGGDAPVHRPAVADPRQRRRRRRRAVPGMTDPATSGGARDLPGFFRLVALDSVDSTNDEARRRLAAGTAAEGTLIWAAEQTAGRGRRGRAWNSP